jgi:predicted N-acetyltransferase YhbS
MPDVTIRPFRRSDRDRLTHLVNRHIAAVVPGASVSVHTVMSQLEREPGEFIVDPWVGERVTLVAEQHHDIVAAALLIRFRDDTDVGDAFRGAGEIRWFVFAPFAPTGNPHWHDGTGAAHQLMAACVEQLRAWSCSTIIADGSLPHPGVYGVPAQWPHVATLYEASGFTPTGDVEIVLMGETTTLASPNDDEALTRSVGINGTRFTLHLDDKTEAWIEVDVLDTSERHRTSGLADIANLHIPTDAPFVDVGRRLVGVAARWLQLGHVERLLAYAAPDEAVELELLRSCRFVEVTRTRRGWRQR